MWYPKSVLELEDKFRTEEQCIDYLYSMKWPDGFSCPRCKANKFWRKSRGRIECVACHHETSVLVSTIFEDSRLSLIIWFRAIWWLIGQKQGTSAVALQKNFGLGSYRTAWLVLHKIRRAMTTVDRTKLNGEVEVDEFYLNGRRGKEASTRNARNKQILNVAAEVVGKGCGRIRISQISGINGPAVRNFIYKNVEVGSTVITDGFNGYDSIEQSGYKRKVYFRNQTKGEGRNDDSRLPRVHRVISLLKRWRIGTLQGRMSKKHVQAYLDEFVFRFNRRTSQSRGLLFFRVLQNAVHTPPTRYRDLANK